MYYRLLVALSLTLSLNFMLLGHTLAQEQLNPSRTAPLRLSGAKTQPSGTAQPTATPAGQTNAPTRRHDPEPLPLEMQRPIAVGLLITLIIVTAVILIHRVQHPRR